MTLLIHCAYWLHLSGVTDTDIIMTKKDYQSNYQCITTGCIPLDWLYTIGLVVYHWTLVVYHWTGCIPLDNGYIPLDWLYTIGHWLYTIGLVYHWTLVVYHWTLVVYDWTLCGFTVNEFHVRMSLFINIYFQFSCVLTFIPCIQELHVCENRISTLR